jgi:hypothetical protein
MVIYKNRRELWFHGQVVNFGILDNDNINVHVRMIYRFDAKMENHLQDIRRQHRSWGNLGPQETKITICKNEICRMKAVKLRVEMCKVIQMGLFPFNWLICDPWENGNSERAGTLQFAGIILCIRPFSMVQQSIRFEKII